MLQETVLSLLFFFNRLSTLSGSEFLAESLVSIGYHEELSTAALSGMTGVCAAAARFRTAIAGQALSALTLRWMDLWLL
jgi:hypothetical protein